MDVNLGVILKRPRRFKPLNEVTPDEMFSFLVSAEGEWHIAGPDFLPSAFGPVTTRALCGVGVVAIGSSNYASRPCAACLEKSLCAIKPREPGEEG